MTTPSVVLSVASKHCAKCNTTKPLTEFSGNRNTRDGLQTQCKDCNRAYYQHNRSYILAREGKRRERLGDELKRRKRDAYWRDPEESRRRARINAAVQNARPTRMAAKAAWARADRATNPEKWRERGRREYANNREGRQQTRHRRRARQYETATANLTPTLLAAKWDYYGGKCWMCGEDACEWDHVKPLSKGGSHILVNLRPACRSCNAQKQAKWPVPTSLRAA